MKSAKSKKGGARPGAGRPKGARSKRTEENIALAEKTGITPLEVLLKSMQRCWDDAEQLVAIVGDSEGLQPADRVKLTEAAAVARRAASDIAKDAAPYVHPRLSSVESKVTADVTNRGEPVDRPPKETREEWLARRQRELAALVPTTGAPN